MALSNTDPRIEKIARKFAELMVEEIGLDKMQEVVRRNEGYGVGVCATHEFCDANMVMAPAMAAALGKTEDEICDLVMGDGDEPDLWNFAWDLARANKFWLPISSARELD